MEGEREGKRKEEVGIKEGWCGTGEKGARKRGRSGRNRYGKDMGRGIERVRGRWRRWGR